MQVSVSADLRIWESGVLWPTVSMTGTSARFEQDEIRFGPFCLTPSARLLTRDGVPVSLSSRALDILAALVEQPGEIIGKADLMARAWPDVTVEEGALRVQMVGLRKALGSNRYITNVPGRGYCFVSTVAEPTKAVQPAPVPELRTESTRSRLVGRERNIETIIHTLRGNRFTSIVGPGGIGKTSIALAALERIRGELGGLAYVVELAPLSDPSLVPAAIAASLGITVQTLDPMPAILSHLGEGECVLLLDNCEHLIDAVAQVAERIYHAAPGAHILATSREALRAEGEHIYPLPGLESPPRGARLTVEEIQAFPAVRLFLEKAEAGGAKIARTVSQLQSIGTICEQLDGIALAIELAAGRVRTYGLEGTAELIENRFWLNWQGRRTAQPRHQTLAAMLDWSYRLLPKDEQILVRRLSIFCGPFRLSDAQYVAADDIIDARTIVDLLGELVAKSLVYRKVCDGEPMFGLLETTRAFALGQLSQVGDVDRMEERRAALMIDRLQAIGLRPGFETAPKGDHDGELVANLRAALQWAFSPDGSMAVATTLAEVAVPYLLGHSLLAECERWSEAALSHLANDDAGSERELALTEARAISSMFTRGNSSEVGTAIADALKLAEDRGDLRRQLGLLAGHNIFVTRIGAFRSALDNARRCEAVAAKLGDPKAAAISEWMLGVAYHLTGDQKRASEHCERGFLQADIAGSFDATAFGYDHRTRALVAFARASWLTGNPDRAIDIARQVAFEASRTDHAVNACIAMVYASPVMLWTGYLDEAQDVIDRLIELASNHSLAPYRATGQAQKGELLIEKGDFEQGLSLLGAAIRTLEDERHHVLSSTFARAYARGTAAAGRPAEAETILDRAIVAAETEGAFDVAELHRIRGEILSSEGRRAEADVCFQRGIAEARAAGALAWELRLAVSAARASHGRLDRASLDELATVRGKFYRGAWSSDLRQADELLASIAR